MFVADGNTVVFAPVASRHGARLLPLPLFHSHTRPNPSTHCVSRHDRQMRYLGLRSSIVPPLDPKTCTGQHDSLDLVMFDMAFDDR